MAERYPDHDVLGEELGPPVAAAHAGPALLDVRSHRRHDQLRARPSDLLLVLRPRDRRRRRGRRPSTTPRATSCSRPNAGSGAWLNGERARGVGQGAAGRCAARHRLSVHRARGAPRRCWACSARSSRKARAVRRLGSAALDVCYVAAGRMEGFWERGLGPWDIAAAALIVEEAGGRMSDPRWRTVRAEDRAPARLERPHPRRDGRHDRQLRRRACSKADALTPACDSLTGPCAENAPVFLCFSLAFPVL